MPLDLMVEKAFRLVKNGKIEELSGGRFNVIGDHGTYIVQIDPNGRLTCSCPGFGRRRMCSHIAAVIIYRSFRSDKSVARQS